MSLPRLPTLVLLVLAAAARADELADRIKAVTDGPLYKPARWGLLVVDAKTGETLYERNPDQFFLPASVTKMFTCATALEELGPDFHFVTPVYRRGEVTDRVLHGDLVLVASGDMTLGGRRGRAGQTLFADNDHTYANSGSMTSTLPDTDPLYGLNELARQVSLSLSEVTGEVLIDDRLFPKARGTGSGPEIVSPILVNDNVVDLVITPGEAEGEPAAVRVRPETAYIQMDADVRTGPRDGKAGVSVEAAGPTQILVRGRVPAGSGTHVRIFPLDDPTLWARALFIEALRRKGVRVAASLHRPRRTDLPARNAELVRMAEYRSEPLADVLKVTLKVSHNLYASTLPVLVGLKNGTGTTEAGLKRQGKVLKRLGVDPQGVSFADGAGGAPADSASPRATVALIQAMAKHPAAKEYFDALPVLGVDGTLADAVPKESPARGKVRGKTGTLSWYDPQNERMLLRSKALAGEVETTKGAKLHFAIFLNDLPIPEGQTASDQGKVLGKICEALYQYGP